ncbi:hypothetical protein [Actinoplanes derwentensis]|uniref:Uncharacterized protein n=1 Tax=Actinoplanes derwentensis TaxID=113562 RepID=A0A1H1VE38_9ACTN|nr:hypothetical protein [Actinoplanes derwentensis]GID83726.1 hypothetical protein Ade03nite_26500 [Actinoplanes derwentensis]SDS83012.1 hypothetical protein SAMN04489716_1730 [Actinoplanes derwentensis]
MTFSPTRARNSELSTCSTDTSTPSSSIPPLSPPIADRASGGTAVGYVTLSALVGVGLLVQFTLSPL